MAMFVCLLFFQLTVFSSSTAAAPSQTPPTSQSQTVPVLSISGAIGPAIGDYLVTEIVKVDPAHSPLIIILIDTPGGLVSSLREINQAILNSKVPVACLVHPSGARAASAGTYMLYACHFAAMSSATTLGAATPVSIGGSPFNKDKQDKPNSEDKPEHKPTASAMEKKILNDSIAYIRALAQLRGRNQEWAELAVKEAATLTATEALNKNVIDLIADSPTSLLQQLDGRKITINNQLHELSLQSAKLESLAPDWRNQFIATITDPNIAYILMIIGIYGLLLEFYSPGVGIAGITGAISLVIALYAFQLLPVNYAGMALLFLGIALFITEALIPSFGIFGLGGVVAFTMGSIFLMDTDQVSFQISPPVIAAMTTVSSLLFIFLLGYLWRSRKKPIVSGQEAIIGAKALVIEDFNESGFVLLEGERWAATTTTARFKGETVTVGGIEELTLILASPPTSTHSPESNSH
ncbi:NfeD family protein [Shewanella nanhaiensis]|uniref:Nodulation protein NfeD n=1 Tax=Shewanella nanhaiensis TaxID=2864872 RepID=A0ABS7E2C8_9GAMM|nr:nodulation protein NfeD [Shewanella nanhaiensis]